jgi:hypothetical protein
METFRYNLFDLENFSDDEDFRSVISESGEAGSAGIGSAGSVGSTYNPIDNATSFEYGEDLGCETLNTEYKLFTLNPLLIEPENSLELLSNGNWVYNQSVIPSIKYYLRTYLAKYIATYTHPLTRISSGNLLIGVDDDGTVYGIPYMGTIPIDIVKNEITNVIKNNIRIKNPSENSEQLLQEFQDKIKVEIVRVSKPKFESTNTIYQEYHSRNQQMMTKWQSYLEKKRIWEGLITKFTQKLHNMLNHGETRRDIISFIKEHSGYLKRNFRTKYSSVSKYCDCRDYYDFISEVRSDFKYKSMKYETIEEMKTNPTNIFYWVTKWKDSKTSIIKSIKPVPPKINFNKNYPMFLLSQVHRMIPFWCTTNPELELYVLKIKIPGSVGKNAILEYLDPTGNWNESYRKVESRGPESIPLS